MRKLYASCIISKYFLRFLEKKVKKHAKSYIYIDNKKTAVCAICLAKELLNVDQRNLDSCVIILLGLTNVV